jgi:AraC-like DNA-binding protein
MVPQPGNGREIRGRQASTSVDGTKAFLDRDAQARKLGYQSWDLGVMRLEQTSLAQKSGKAHRRSNWHDNELLWRPGQSSASAYLQEGSPPDQNFRILIAALDDVPSEQLLTAFLPCALLRKSVFSLSGKHMLSLDSWHGAILANHLLSLAHELPSIPKAHWPILGAATCALVQACLARPSGSSIRTDTSTMALRERLRCVVKQNMSSPDFGPEALGRLAAMSRSKLYRIFEGTGGVARFIQDERLRAARRRLANIGDRTSIRALAGEVGFLEHSTFSRAFKRRYGCSPREFREIVSDRHYREARDDRHHAGAMP